MKFLKISSYNLNKTPPLRIKLFEVVLILFLNIRESFSICYFPIEMQGVYINQGSVAISNNSTIQYSQISITEDSIPILGICNRRLENNNVLLMISSDETTCYRCFNLKLVSRNIIRLLTTDKDFIFKCYANEEKVIQSCPADPTTETITIDQENERKFQYNEIILYKTLTYDGAEVRGEYCPFNGPYKIIYYNYYNKTNLKECSEASRSKLDNCPSGSILNFRFKGCSFENQDIVFECLGQWTNHKNHTYLALRNLNSKNENIIFKSEYRCATYNENLNTGIIRITFSKDSTCSIKEINNNIENKNYVEQLETLILNPFKIENKNLIKDNICKFPIWLHGHWQDINVINDTLIYRDQTSYKTYTMKCIEKFTEENYIVFSQTQCGEEMYQCIKIKNRDKNIIEFQISSKTSNIQNIEICNESNFNIDNWLPQSKEDKSYQYSSCPINGVYNGIIPDAPNLCAKLTSNCNSKDIMYYEVFSCDFNEIYEERKYRCIGQWKDNKFVYTYTKRLDVLTYECFIGAQINEDNIFIKEAGEHCGRLINPLKHGMELNKTGNCNNQTQSIIYTNQRYFRNMINSTTNNDKYPANKVLTTQQYLKNNDNDVFIPPPSHIVSAILKENIKLRDGINHLNNFTSVLNDSYLHKIYNNGMDDDDEFNIKNRNKLILEQNIKNNKTNLDNYNVNLNDDQRDHHLYEFGIVNGDNNIHFINNEKMIDENNYLSINSSKFNSINIVNKTATYNQISNNNSQQKIENTNKDQHNLKNISYNFKDFQFFNKKLLLIIIIFEIYF